MHTCLKCGKEIKTYVKIDGKLHNLHSRKYCLECSPFGKHNTKKLGILKENKVKKCIYCGETDPKKFSKNNYKQCRNCKRKYNLNASRSKQTDIIKYLGSKCRHCGYDLYLSSLDIHHLDPSKKDKNFNTHRYWSWDRILNEIENCILLCRNCHGAYHNGLINDNDLIKIPLPNDINDIRENIDIEYKIQDEQVHGNAVKRLKNKICPICNNEYSPINSKQKYCSNKCSRLAHRKVERPSYEQLLKDLEDLNNNFCAVGRKYNVSDNCIRKWLIYYER